jgi:hypothetical protein
MGDRRSEFTDGSGVFRNSLVPLGNLNVVWIEIAALLQIDGVDKYDAAIPLKIEK